MTSISLFWFNFLSSRVPNLRTHLISPGLPSAIAQSLPQDAAADLSKRSMLVRRLQIFPIESIVRGYLTGSAWAEYQSTGFVHGISMPTGLRDGSRFPLGAIWTPSTKAEPGAKDENIHPERAAELVGREAAAEIARLSLALYNAAHDYAAQRGIIIADTKFEFGFDPARPGEVILVDEVLTPDSSRFWPLNEHEEGRTQRSYDKQPLRDWLVGQGLKGKEDVEMTVEVVQGTRKRYEEAFRSLTDGPVE